MRFLVTGATGFVGSHVVDRLLEQGESVRALVLEPNESESLRTRGVNAFQADLTDGADLTRALDGVDVVVHCAGIVPDRLSAVPGGLWQVNLGGTEQLLAASARTGITRFVHLSSVVVYGIATSTPVTEDAAKRPIGAYSESKWAAELALWRYHAEHQLPVVAVRPCWIYGPRDQKFTPGLLRRCGQRVMVLPDGGHHLLDLVFVSDVVDAVLAAATNPQAVGRAYNITDGEKHSLREIGTVYRDITGRSPTVVTIPTKRILPALRFASHVMPGRVLGNLALGLEMFRHDIHYAIDAARRDLRYAPRVGLCEGLRRSLEWSLRRAEPVR
jgi:nucleoside-diphosphate-sugar epimerase